MATIGNMNVKIIRDSSDHTGMPLEVEVEYLGVRQTFSGDAVRYALHLLLLNDGNNMTPEQLIDQVRVMDRNTIHTPVPPVQQPVQQQVQQTQTVQRTETQQTVVNETNNEEDVENHRFRVTGIGKKLLSLVTAGVILVVGHFVGSGIVRAIRGNNNQEENIDFSGPAIEQPVTEQPIDTTATTPEPVYITPEPVIGNDVIAPPVSITGSENLPYVNGSTTDWISMTDAEYLEALNSQSIACQMNMPEISLFLEGEELEGTKQLTSIQKTFKPGSIEYCVVEHFNEFRNEVDNAAYDTRNRESTQLVLDHHISELYLFCTNQKSVTLNTPYGVHEYWWNDLSEEAKNALLDVFFGLTIALPHEYSVNVNGTYMNAVNFSEFYEAQLSFLTLVNPTNRR